MKQILSIALATLLTFGAVSSNAQALKIGWINSNELMEGLPEVEAVKTELETYTKQQETRLAGLYAEYQSIVAEYQRDQAGMSEQVRGLVEADIYKQQQNIGEFEQKAQGLIASKQEALYGPIYDAIRGKIDEYAKANGYTYILDYSLGTILYGAETHNLNDKIKATLGNLQVEKKAN